MKHVAPHEISGPKSARPHGGIPSPGAEQRRGQSMGDFWPRIYVVKKGHMHGAYISYCRRAIFGTSSPRPPVLIVKNRRYAPAGRLLRGRCMAEHNV
jgi:hypothetical protein